MMLLITHQYFIGNLMLKINFRIDRYLIPINTLNNNTLRLEIALFHQ